MSLARECDIPPAGLLRQYAAAPGFADCYCMDIGRAVSQPAFVVAFYSTPLFKVERLILKLLAARAATDGDAKALAAGSAKTFSAWRVEAQSADQLLMADVTGRTRSWLMASALPVAAGAVQTPLTRLYFGSAVLPKTHRATGKQAMGAAFHALLGFHRLYSRLLLQAAVARLLKTN